jgi:hypothetical protein
LLKPHAVIDPCAFVLKESSDFVEPPDEHPVSIATVAVMVNAAIIAFFFIAVPFGHLRHTVLLGPFRQQCLVGPDAEA